MNVSHCKSAIAQCAADAVVVGLFANEKLSGPAAEANRAADGLLTKLIERQEIAGKKFELTPLLAPSGFAAGQLLVVGLGERAKFNAGVAYRAAAAASKHLAGKARG